MIARYLNTDGAAGRIPAWYRLLKAAKYMGVSPWDLSEKTYWWVTRAEAAMDAEERHRNHLRDHRK